MLQLRIQLARCRGWRQDWQASRFSGAPTGARPTRLVSRQARSAQTQRVPWPIRAAHPSRSMERPWPTSCRRLRARPWGIRRHRQGEQIRDSSRSSPPSRDEYRLLSRRVEVDRFHGTDLRTVSIQDRQTYPVCDASHSDHGSTLTTEESEEVTWFFDGIQKLRRRSRNSRKWAHSDRNRHFHH